MCVPRRRDNQSGSCIWPSGYIGSGAPGSQAEAYIYGTTRPENTNMVREFFLSILDIARRKSGRVRLLCIEAL